MLPSTQSITNHKLKRKAPNICIQYLVLNKKQKDPISPTEVEIKVAKLAEILNLIKIQVI